MKPTQTFDEMKEKAQADLLATIERWKRALAILRDQRYRYTMSNEISAHLDGKIIQMELNLSELIKLSQF